MVSANQKCASNRVSSTLIMELAPTQATSRRSFDISDYLNFEAGDDFIPLDAEPIIDYSRSEHILSAVSKAVDIDQNMFSLELNDQIYPVDEFMDDTDKSDDEGYNYTADENEFESVIDEVLSCSLNNYTLTKPQRNGNAWHDDCSIADSFTPSFYPNYDSSIESCEPYQEGPLFKSTPGDDFKIFDLGDPEFRCCVVKDQSSPCEKSTCCSKHSYLKKGEILGSAQLDHLIRNHDYLMKVNSDITKEDPHDNSVGMVMKRHNSFQNDVWLSSHQARSHKDNRILLLDNADYNEEESELSNMENSGSNAKGDLVTEMAERELHHLSQSDKFYISLVQKLSTVSKDVEKRLLEFHYKVDMKNFAAVQFFKENHFEL